MAARKAAAAAGVSGVIFSVTGSGQSAENVHVSLDYSSFAFADGGGYAGRLHLVELPACALTTPSVPSCRRQTSLTTAANDVTSYRLGADVTLAGSSGASGLASGVGATSSAMAIAAPAASAVVLAATTSTSGSAGDYTASPLSEAGTWTAGGASGAFTYSYPIAVPPVPGGLAPQVNLSYNSQAVDGLTSSTNAQASWIGDGWGYQPGYIERGYQSCETTSAKTGDLCWSSNNITTLSLGGMTTTLVDDASTGWHTEADNGDKVQYLTGASNGTHDGGYWVVTDAEGTSYYFGENQPPGFVSGDATTNSAWTVPVYATASGQPCYNSTFASAHCVQGWRWNLDYVTDSHSDAMALFYNTETNYYAADNGTKATTSYIQGGALSKIQYGLRAGQVYGATSAGEVDFTTATDRTDVPTGSSADLACASGATCDVISPTFWMKYRLTTITTKSLQGTSLTAVDSWALTQDYPATGDGSSAPPMWLESITQTGEDGSTHITMPPVKFAGISLANRVETQTDLNDGYSIIERFRISQVTSETGGATQVTYDTPPSSCTSGNFPAEDANGTVCYPDYWTPPGASNPVEDWFNKYVVTAVTQANTSGVPETTTYCYGASPGCLSSGGWHYNDDALTRSKNRTWDQWRGFRTVITETGTTPDPVTETVDTYFQGMNGDYQSGGGTSSASLSATVNGKTITATDSDQFSGMNFRKIAYDGAGGSVVTDTVTTPWSSSATATQSQPSPLPALQAFMTGVGETQTFTALAAGGYSEAEATNHHDASGRIDWEANVPDTSDPSEDTCTQSTYTANPAAWTSDLPAEKIVTAVPPSSCPVSGTPTQAELVSDIRYFYDGSTTLGAAPSAGNVTLTQDVSSYSGSSPVFTSNSKSVYDEYGRVTSATDADTHTTTTSYSPATGAEPTSKTVTDPMGLVTTTTYDPARDLTLTVTNPAGWVTTEAYDAVGRLTSVWTPGHSTSGPADKTFSYAISATAPSVITTNTINSAGTYLSSEVIYDSLGRQVETQAETPDGNRTVTDTYYNSDGWQQVTSSPYYTTGTPSATLVAAPDDQVPQQTGYAYDGDGRVLRKITYSYATELWETDTTYGGDYTTVTPPAGGTAATTYTNGIGKTSYIYQYHSAAPSSPPAPGSGSVAGSSGWDQTGYTYTAAATLTSVIDAAGSTWSYTYDLAGNQLTASDPDAGTTTSSYDANGNLLSATDGRGKTISYTYDADGRKTAEYDTTGGVAETASNELASWKYDSLAKGQATSSTSYGPGGTSGTAYTSGVVGYNSYGVPTGSTETISAGPLAGTYKHLDYYASYGNVQTSSYDYAAGGLPGETVGIGYNAADQPISIGSSLWTYVASLAYTELGQPQEYALGTTTEPAWVLNNWNLGTGRLDSTAAQAGTNPVTADNVTYGYANAGNVTSEADVPAGGPQQAQCFQYDYAGRLTQAWSQGSSGCTSGPSQSAEAGAAAPYWDQYSYNVQNDLTKVLSTPSSGQSTTYTDSYPAAGSSQPHAISGQQLSGGLSGSSTFGYNASGQLTSQSGLGGNQALSWDDAGRLASVVTSAGTTSYVYSSNGSLLLETDPGTVTLYLPWGEQLTENVSTGAVSGVRNYSIGGVAIAARPSTGDVQYLIGDQQGTAVTAIDAGNLTVTHRYYDPYGNEIGPEPASWPGSRGFVGGTADTATGLTNLGAREYNPATASFISPDSIVNPYDPADLNAYAYAADSPVTESDPTGAMPCIADGPCGSFQFLEHWSAQQQARPAPSEPICYYCYDPQYAIKTFSGFGGYSGGRTAPYSPGYYGPVNDVHTPLFAALPPPRVVHSPRVVTPRQVSTGQVACNSVASRFAAGPCVVPKLSGGGGNPFGWLAKHWRGVAHVAIDVGGALGAGACVAFTDGICAAFLPQIGAAIGAANYAVSGGPHTASGYAHALGEGALVGTAAAACTILCGEAVGAAVTVGGSAALLGGDIGAYDYIRSPGPHTWPGFFEAFGVGVVENGPWPFEKIFGG
jgi:RHS repeat-associated protein